MEEVEVEVEVEVPAYFLCPISLQIMRDPVILPTGITYDRESIERWLFAGAFGSTPTCPVTRQPLPPPTEALDLIIPNHTLRRLIQAWCTVHAAERFPTPKPPVDRLRVAQLLDESQLLDCLRKLKAVVGEGERNRRCVESTPGAVEFLAAAIRPRSDDDAACDAAIDVLSSLKLSEPTLLALAEGKPEFVDSLAGVLRRPNYRSRAHAAAVLRSLTGVLPPERLAGLGEEVFWAVTSVLRDRVSHQTTKAALHVLVELSLWGRNRVKAVNSGAVAAAIEILMEDAEDRRTCELALAVVERLCGCAEGRAELVGHAAGVAVVAKKALRVSHAATDRAVRALCSVARHAATAAVLGEMASVGAVSKLCLVLQSDYGDKTKERVREVLRLHSRVWMSSPCLSPQFLALYPPPPPSS